MDYTKYQYFILCEDKTQFDFAVGWLRAKGVNRRRIHSVEDFPHEGCGYAFVKNKFLESVKIVTGKNRGCVNSCLIVMCDMDTKTYSKIDEHFPIAPGDPIFLVTPKRNIQTWAHYLSDPEHYSEIDESKDYKAAYRGAKYGKLGKQLAEMKRQEVESGRGYPESLLKTWDRISRHKSNL